MKKSAFVCGEKSITTSRMTCMNNNHFPLELDHIFIWVKPNAPEAILLEEMGIKPTPKMSEHRGQGTASELFLFENTYLELIWISDENVAQQNMKRTGIDWRSRGNWQQTGASPFGIGLHRRSGAGDLTLFPLKYWADWMQPDTLIHFAGSATNNRQNLYFVVPEYMAFATQLQQYPENIKKLVDLHPLGVKKLTDIKIILANKTELTAIDYLLGEQNIAKIEIGQSPLLELTFEGGLQGMFFDLRPVLPMIINQ